MGKPADPNSESAGGDLSAFIDGRVTSLAQLFAGTPLMSLTVETPEGTVTFEKAVPTTAPEPAAEPAAQPRRPHRHERATHDGLMHDAESGHPYDTVNAEIVGVFHTAEDLPTPGEPVEDGEVLGYIEALKLRNPVHNQKRGIFVAQIAEEGQAVDFGEALFVIDHSEPAPSDDETAQAEALEPPRL